MQLRYVPIVLLWLLLSGCLFAQQSDIDWFLERTEEFEDASDVLEILAELETHPLDLNQATAEQLMLLPWISEPLARRLVAYRLKRGPFRDVDDLARIPRFNAELIPLLRPYITVSAAERYAGFSLALKTRMINKLEKSIGLRTGTYFPSPAKIYNRLNLNYNNRLDAGIILEKDSGERRWNDLAIGFIKFTNPGRNYKLILGNYRLEFAHGLVFGNPMYYGKGYQPLFPAKRQSRELVEYTLVDENASLYGMAGQLSFKFYQIFIFYSAQQLDATPNPDGTIKNFYLAGYHRTPTELHKRDQLTEKMVGARLGMSPTTNISLGVTTYQSRYDQPIVPDIKSESLFAFQGKTNRVLGIDFSALIGQVNVFGEAARSGNFGEGLIFGAAWDTPIIEMALIARYYSKNFQSLHARSFSESGDRPQNETGVYMGLQLTPLKRLKLTLSHDLFQFPWATYLMPLPTGGQELVFRAEYRSQHKLNLYWQLKTTQKDHSLSYQDALNRTNNIIAPRRQLTARWQVEYQPWSSIRLRGRIETTWINYDLHTPSLPDQYPRRHGILLFQEISLTVNKNLTFNSRLTFFDTEDYDSRLYQYEHDVPSLMTNSLLYGVGNRWYANLQWKIGSLFRLSAKFSSTRYYFQETIGTGWDLIPSNRLHSLHVQFEASF